MEFLSAVIAAAVLSAPVVGPTGVELERLVDGDDPFPGVVGPVDWDGPPPVPCGRGVAFRANSAASPVSWIYYATSDGIDVVADEETLIPGAGSTFEEIAGVSCLGGARVLFLGFRGTPPAVPGSAFAWRPGSGVELLQSGGVTIDGIAFDDFVEAGGNAFGVGLEGQRVPGFLGEGLVMKPFGQPPEFVADTQVILPGRIDPVNGFTSPQMFREDLVFGALVVLSRGLYRWSQASGFSVVADDATPVPGGAGTFTSVTSYTVLSGGIAFTGIYGGGAGIFQYDHTGAIEPLVLPGDQTVGGETVVSAFSPDGEGALFSFRGTTAETAPFESVFARTGDGSIFRILGERDDIEGKTVLWADGGADRDTVAVRVTTMTDFEEIIYTVDFGEALPIPVLSRSTLAILTMLLLGTGLWLVARSR